ncbi:GlxA family transcriptional regulator [Haloechinothrix salitolerans]|uniref:GlxA family transcriptional regulator n=1 Tax=Haloechinothrix salitolerans TaxID=926830 RepID=A0ABW2C6J5_9PSEU
MTIDRLVLIVVYEGVQLLDVAGPAEVFSTAAKINGGSGYRLVIASPDGDAVRTDSGLTLGVDIALADAPARVDTLVVAGGLGAFTAVESPELLAALAPLRNARRVCSVCTGALLLAATGWLRGRRATTHWMACGDLACRHPDIDVEPDRIFVRDDDVYTSAGVTAGMDLALALVEDDHGAELARAVARALVLFLQRPGGQSQFSARLDHPVPADTTLRPVLDTIITDPAADHRLPNLAARAAVSERHLTRLFLQHTGTTPGRFVERVRVEAARGLLEREALGVRAVAARTGFGSEETLRRAFLRVLGVAPSEYRARFRSAQPEFEEVS